MPFLIGVHESLYDRVRKQQIEEHVLVDLDRNVLTSPFNDVAALPTDFVSLTLV
jgi:DENN domain-containing protein 1